LDLRQDGLSTKKLKNLLVKLCSGKRKTDMWILLLMVMTSSGEIIAYDQGRYEFWNDCYETGKAMIADLDSNQRFTCVEW